MTARRVNIAGYDNTSTIKTDVPIGSGITAVDLPDGETVLLRVHEASFLGDDAHTLISLIQLHENGVEVDDKPRRHGGTCSMTVDGYVIPFELDKGLVTFKIRKPTAHELDTCEMIELTSDVPWHPETITDMDITTTDYGLMCRNADVRRAAVRRTTNIPYDPKLYAPYLLFPGARLWQILRNMVPSIYACPCASTTSPGTLFFNVAALMKPMLRTPGFLP